MILKTLLLLTILSCNSRSKPTYMQTKKIIGVSTVTTNEDGQSNEDMGKLWGQFFKLSQQIPNKKSDEIYAIYTDYETDYRGKHTAIVGYEVHSLDIIPIGLVGREIGGGEYLKILAKGEMPTAVMQAWKEIWKKDKELNRRYTADFEVHGVKSQNGKEAEVDIFIAVN